MLSNDNQAQGSENGDKVSQAMERANSMKQTIEAEIKQLEEQRAELLKEQEQATQERKDFIDSLGNSEAVEKYEAYEKARANFAEVETANREQGYADKQKLTQQIADIDIEINRQKNQKLKDGSSDEDRSGRLEEINNNADNVNKQVLDFYTNKYPKEASDKGLTGEEAEQYVRNELGKQGFTEEEINEN